MKLNLVKNNSICQEDEIFETNNEDGSFVYCLPRHRTDKKARYDPYDIEVVSPEEARARREVFTASVSAITLVSFNANIGNIILTLIFWQASSLFEENAGS